MRFRFIQLIYSSCEVVKVINGQPLSDQIQGCFNRFGAKIYRRYLSDGTSFTILIGEVLPAEHDHLSLGFWMYHNHGASHVGTLAPINFRTDVREACVAGDPAGNVHRYQNWNTAWGFKSRHQDGVNFLFGDGSVRFVEESIDHQIYQWLGARADGQSIPGTALP